MSPARARCRAIAKSGKRCGMNPQENGVCFIHDEARAEERAASQKKGGHERQKLVPMAKALGPEAAEVKLDGKADVLAIMRDTITHVRRGQLDYRVANVIGSLCGVALKSFDEGDLARRLKELEERVRPLQGLSAEALLDFVKAAHANGVAAAADAAEGH